MNNTRIFDWQTNIEFDLYEGTNIALTFQNNSPEKINSFQSDFSVSFELPATSNNKRLLQNCQVSTATSLNPYRFTFVKVVTNGVEIFPKALLLIESSVQNIFGKDIFKVRVFSGIINLFAILGNKLIQELDLSLFNHSYVPQTVANSQTNTWLNGYIYNFIDRGQIDFNRINIKDLPPSIYFRRIFEQIFFELGVNFTFQRGFPDSYNTMVLPHTNKPRALPNDYAKNKNGEVATADFTNINPSVDTQLNFSLVSQPTYNSIFLNFDALGNYYVSRFRENSVLYDWAYFAVKIDIDLQDATFPFSRAFTASVYAYTQNAPIPGTKRLLHQQNFTGGGKLFVDKNIYINIAGGEVRFGIEIVSSFGSTWALQSTGKFKVTPINNLDLFNQTWEVAPNLPKIKCTDFIKDYLIQEGLVMRYDVFDNKITFQNYSDFLINFRAIKWQNKVDYLKPIETYYVIDGLAQNNKLVFEEVSDVLADNGNGVIVVDNTTIEFENEFYKSPYAFLEFNNTGFNFPISLIETLKNTTTEGVGDEFFRTKTDLQETKPRKAFVFESPIGKNVNIFGENNEIDSYFRNVNITKILQNEGLDWQSVIENKLQGLLAFVDKAQRIQVYLKLSESEIQNLPLLKPIYLEEFGRYYYLNKVEQYVNSSQTVKCELIRISDGLFTTFSFKNGLLFDGIAQKITVPHRTNLDFEHTDNFSLSVILKPSNFDFNTSGSVRGIGKIRLPDGVSVKGWQFFFMSFFSGGQRFFLAGLFITQNNIDIKISSQSYDYNDVENQNIHLIVVKNSNNPNDWIIKLWNIDTNTELAPIGTQIINGAISTSIKSTNPVTINSQPFIEQYNNNILFDLNLFNRELSTTEINELYLSRGEFYDSSASVLHTKYDEKQGLITLDSTTADYYDLVGYTPSQVVLGAGNSWKDSLGNSILI